jgi:hypothetical protein
MQAKFRHEAIQVRVFNQLLPIRTPNIGHFTRAYMLIPIPLVDCGAFFGVG